MKDKKVTYDEYSEPLPVCCDQCRFSRVRFDCTEDIWCVKHEARYDGRINRGCCDYVEEWY